MFSLGLDLCTAMVEAANDCLFFLNDSRNGPGSVVTSVFGGILQNEVNCLICGTESRKYDPFLGKMAFVGK